MKDLMARTFTQELLQENAPVGVAVDGEHAIEDIIEFVGDAPDLEKVAWVVEEASDDRARLSGLGPRIARACEADDS